MMHESFVVYLFSKFHEQLGFEKVLEIDSSFPDCLALKEGKKVSIEFEVNSNSLQTHLWYGGWNKYQYQSNYKCLMETDTEYKLYDWGAHCYRDSRKEDAWAEVLSKNVYSISVDENRDWTDVKVRKLPLDYCICWKLSQATYSRSEYEGIKFLELSKIPLIQTFMKERGYNESQN